MIFTLLREPGGAEQAVPLAVTQQEIFSLASFSVLSETDLTGLRVFHSFASNQVVVLLCGLP